MSSSFSVTLICIHCRPSTRRKEVQEKKAILDTAWKRIINSFNYSYFYETTLNLCFHIGIFIELATISRNPQREFII